jgi:nucleoside-diphosphate-sugar epimerase
MATYLVTGAAGFIAARTAQLLLDAGHTVVGVDNLNDYYDVRLKQHRLAQLTTRPNFTFARADIEQLDALEPLFARHKFDAVLNLAARAGVRSSMENPFVYLTTNALGTLNLLELMRRHGVKKHVLASSSSLYAGQKMPFTEDLPVNTPVSPYAASKKAAEVLAYSYHHLYQIDSTVLRYFTAYGPASRPDMAQLRFTRWIDEGKPLELFGDGTQSRDFTYVDDIARGTIAALKPLGYEVINLGGGRNPITLAALIEKLEALLGKKAVYDRQPFHVADIKETWADIGKAERLLGWKPRTGIDEGLKLSVDWYRANQDWVRELKS